MTLSRVTTALATLVGLASIWFGVSFLLDPQGSAANFGITPWPSGNAAGYFTAKAVRDIAAGAVALLLLARGHRTALGWVALIDTAIPLGDLTAVLTHHGSPGAAAMHGSTAAVMLVLAALLLREAPALRPAPAL